VFKGIETPAHGDPVFDGRQRVGTVTSAVRSPALGCTIAMARVVSERAAPDMALEVGRLDGQLKRLGCRTAALPFVDPQRTRARS
jgi:aminomethyltransferase